jgi:hypothetical protein
VDFLKKNEETDEFTANCIIKTQVIGGLIPYQMFEFYSTFGCRYLSIWRNLSYEDAHQMLDSLWEKRKDVDKEIVKEIVKEPAITTSTPTTSQPMSNCLTKNKKSN